MKVWMAGLLAASIGLLAGCGAVVQENRDAAAHREEKQAALYDPSQYPVTIKTLGSDGEQHEETFSAPPERVVAIWQNSIETLIALGEGDRIIAAMGLPSGDYLRPEYRAVYGQIPYTSMENLDVETIAMMDPDFIVGWSSSFDGKTLRGTDFWGKRGVHTYISPGSSPVVKFHTIDYEYQDILHMGQIFGKREEAESIVAAMEQEIRRAEEEAARQARRPRGLIIELQGKNMTVYGKRTLAGDILKRMGGELLAEDIQQISKEQLIEMDPDAVFVVVIESKYGSEQQILDLLYQEKALQDLRCIKEKKLYALPLYAVYSAGVRTYDGIRIIGKGLYPDLYQDSPRKESAL